MRTLLLKENDIYQGTDLKMKKFLEFVAKVKDFNGISDEEELTSMEAVSNHQEKVKSLWYKQTE